MKSFGLALSGGGFRACLYHLGVIRFLRDANLLSQIDTITSVSGGSVIGAHLALNWDRYCGTDEEFQDVADELLRFLQLDVRNRIVRRFPFGSLVNFGRRTLRLGTYRQYTRVGLLEQHYEKYLYGDTGLFCLPKSPRLYILATNLSEGSVCAFHRGGMLLQRRQSDGHYRFDEINMGLATVPMAVAASSAFPGFFPPLELRAHEVGARAGEFDRQALTDGGIYDNVGLRMLRHLEDVSIAAGTSSDVPKDKNGKVFDGIFVSNAGASFKVRTGDRAGGLLTTAMRSSDILLDRVNQLELESFRGTPGVLFFPITGLVKQTSDQYAPHEEIQRQAALIRTDMDRFSNLEISALVQHGYCVAREVCRHQTSELLTACPSNPPWDPIDRKTSQKNVLLRSDKDALTIARKLQESSSRRIVSTLLSFRDWPTYIWVPLLAIILFASPYYLYRTRQLATQRGYVLQAIRQTSPLYNDILGFLSRGPVTEIESAEVEDVDRIEKASYDGFEILSDDRIMDLRGWNSRSTVLGSAPYFHSRMQVRRVDGSSDNTHLRFQSPTTNEGLNIVCRTESLRPRYRRAQQPDGGFIWEMDLDFSHVPIRADQEFVCDGFLISDSAEQLQNEARFQFTVFADTALLRIWMIMPEDRSYERLEIRGFPIDEPENWETVTPLNAVELPIGSIATFQLINPRHDYRYECRWRWSSNAKN